MTAQDNYPKLRHIEVFPATVEGRRVICLRDPSGFSDGVLLISEGFIPLLALLDGQHSLLDIQAEIYRRTGELVFRDRLQEIISQLDAGLLLESPRFNEAQRGIEEDFRRETVRRPMFAGKSYPEDPAKLRAQLEGYFSHPEGPASKPSGVGAGALVGVVAPHIDFTRGGPCYAWAYREIRERGGADLVVILGTGHAQVKSFYALTRKDFETPLGRVEADRAFIERLVGACGEDVFQEEIVHRGEHSIEFQVVFLRYVLGPDRPFTVVPIMCGSFQEFIARRRQPKDDPRVARFLEALRQTVAQSARRVLLLAAADLAHAGPRYGDRSPVTAGWLGGIAAADREMLERVEAADAEGFFRAVAADQDRRRICGVSCIYTLLEAMGPGLGRLLKYGQWPDPEGSVTFASVAFVRDTSEEGQGT